jgi:hypothetical protein
MRCRRNISKYDESFKRDISNLCPKKARVFYKTKYVGQSIAKDVFGFCEECAKGMESTTSWTIGWHVIGSVRGLRYNVESLQLVAEKDAVDGKEEKFREAVKIKLKNAFVLKWTKKLSREEWTELFQEALDEHTVESVMGS